MPAIPTQYDAFSEQDTVDTLILPWLSSQHGFPKAESLDYQAQHTITLFGGSGRYDGLYLSGGYPYVVLEAKRYSHDLTSQDEAQAREYATSAFFDKPVPFIVVSNGREYRFFKLSGAIDPSDSQPAYVQIPETDWSTIKLDSPGEVRRLLSEDQLLDTLRIFKQQSFADISAAFRNPSTGKLEPERHPLGGALERIVRQRRLFAGDTTSRSATKEQKTQQALRQALEAIALHFTLKILFIKLIEDLSRGADSPRVIHTLFPQRDYDQVGGLFGYKVLNALDAHDDQQAFRLFIKSRTFYRRMLQDIAKVSWQDIFRYGFNVHRARFGQLFRARDYDRFMPSEATLAGIREKLITIDVRTAIVYGSPLKRSNVIGHIYERLIDDELRSGLGAVYTPDATMRFMIDLAEHFLGGFRGKKIVEPACGSGHFYREVYRRYVDEVIQAGADPTNDSRKADAHLEALEHVFGRDIDPFAVQLTLLSIFLEQLKDNVRPLEAAGPSKRWPAGRAVETQNSLDPVTIDPLGDMGIETTLNLAEADSLRASCLRAIDPEMVIGNPPYGVEVVPGARYDTIYRLGSTDSYGYFIVNALKRLSLGGRVIFVVSSSFLTIGTHRKLREEILRSSKIVRVIKLHRATFPGIDIFPVIIELEKCAEATARDENVYQFYDLWQLHPINNAGELDSAYQAILDDLDGERPWPFPSEVSKRYLVRQGVLHRYSGKPIFEGRPSLYEYMADVVAQEIELTRADGSRVSVPCHTVRDRSVVKLRRVADTKIGLQSGNNRRFYRAAPGVRGGATRGGYMQVPLHQIVTDERLASMTPEEMSDGFNVDDLDNDRFYVPLDKAGESDIEGGILSQFQRPIEFYIDWSRAAVSEMKTLPGARFQNSVFYFRRGISFSNTGIYAPTFRFGHGGVFDQTGSSVFSDFLEPRVLIALLSSTLMRYFVKSFVDHGVHARLDDLPIVLPDQETVEKLTAVVDRISDRQKVNPAYDYRPDADEIDELIFELYGLDSSEREEVSTWYIRHYPKLVKGIMASAQPEEDAA